jgi:hypothetical protein
MKFAFTVGDEEKHTVEYHCNRLFGNTRVKVDGETVSNKYRDDLSASVCVHLWPSRG